MAYTYSDIKKRIYKHRIIGSLILVLVSISTVVSLLNMLYASASGGSPGFPPIDQSVQKLVGFIYQNTTAILKYFWLYSPQPSPKNLVDIQTLYFLGIYAMSFIGIAYLNSARDWSRRLREIDKQIQDEMIKASVTGQRIRRRQEIEESIPIDRAGLSEKFHSLYLAPLIVGVIIAVITKLLGLG